MNNTTVGMLKSSNPQICLCVISCSNNSISCGLRLCLTCLGSSLKPVKNSTRPKTAIVNIILICAQAANYCKYHEYHRHTLLVHCPKSSQSRRSLTIA